MDLRNFDVDTPDCVAYLMGYTMEIGKNVDHEKLLVAADPGAIREPFMAGVKRAQDIPALGKPRWHAEAGIDDMLRLIKNGMPPELLISVFTIAAIEADKTPAQFSREEIPQLLAHAQADILRGTLLHRLRSAANPSDVSVETRHITIQMTANPFLKIGKPEGYNDPLPMVCGYIAGLLSRNVQPPDDAYGTTEDSDVKDLVKAFAFGRSVRAGTTPKPEWHDENIDELVRVCEKDVPGMAVLRSILHLAAIEAGHHSCLEHMNRWTDSETEKQTQGYRPTASSATTLLN